MAQVGALSYQEPVHCKSAAEVMALAYRIHDRRVARCKVIPLHIEHQTRGKVISKKPSVSFPLTNAHCNSIIRLFWASESDRIISNVAKKHGFTPKQLMARRRLKPLVQARHEAMYWMYKKTELSLPQIGRKFGGFDHTSVLNGVRAHARRNNLPLLVGHKHYVRK